MMDEVKKQNAEQNAGQNEEQNSGMQENAFKDNKLGTQPVGRLLIGLALPAIAAQLINLLYNAVDRIYIGHIPGEGSDALTGLGFTLPVIILISAFASLVGAGGAPKAAIAIGKGDHDTAEEILGNCFSALILVALLLSVFFFIFAEPVLKAFGASADTMPYAFSYLRIYVLGTVFVLITTGMNAFITSQGFAMTAMKTTMIGAGINLILDPIFIYGFSMGVEGAAVATIISQAISASWVVLFLTGKKTILKIKKKNLKIKPAVMGSVMALGISPFIMQSTESLLSICFNTSLVKYGGDIAVGAMTILGSVMQATMLPIHGMSQGMTPIISYNYGAKQMDRVRKAFTTTLIISLTYTAIMWAAAMFVPHLLAGIFTPDEELISYCSWAMRIYMGGMCIFGAQIACQQTFVAMGKAVQSLFLAALRKLILLIPLIYIIPCFTENKVFGIFLAEPVSDVLAVLATVTLFRLTVWKMLKGEK